MPEEATRSGAHQGAGKAAVARLARLSAGELAGRAGAVGGLLVRGIRLLALAVGRRALLSVLLRRVLLGILLRLAARVARVRRVARGRGAVGLLLLVLGRRGAAVRRVLPSLLRRRRAVLLRGRGAVLPRRRLLVLRRRVVLALCTRERGRLAGFLRGTLSRCKRAGHTGCWGGP